MRRKVFVAGAAALGTIAFAGGAVTLAYPSRPVARDDRPPPAFLEPDAMRGDIAAFARTLVEVGTEPFMTCSPERFAAARSDAEAACAARLPIAEFWRRIARLAAALDDGHVAIQPTFASGKPGREYPFTLAIDGDGRPIVTADLSGTNAVPAGSEVLAINGRSAATIVAEAIAVSGGQTPVIRRVHAPIRAALVALRASRDAYAVELRTPGGQERTVRVAACSWDQLAARHRAHAGDPAPYRFALTADRIARIDYDACRDQPRFRRFLAKTFTRIRDVHPRAVVVDLRRNGGGDSSLNDDLFSYLTDRPYQQFGAMRVRTSERLRRELGFWKYAEEYMLAAFLPNGTVTNLALGWPRAPGANALRFGGPVYYLVGPRTFSSAQKCAIAVRDFGLGTLVGDEVAEPALTTGEVYPFTLPASRLVATVTTKVWVPPKPHPPGEGIAPDIRAPLSARDVALGRDPGMDAVRAHLASS